jgi:oleate hydratase
MWRRLTVTLQERAELGLTGRLPAAVETLDSVIRPILDWLEEREVRPEYAVTVTVTVTVTDVDFDMQDPGARRATRLHLTRGDGPPESIELGPGDYVFITNGSMTADTAYGDSATVPELIRDQSGRSTSRSPISGRWF